MMAARTWFWAARLVGSAGLLALATAGAASADNTNHEVKGRVVWIAGREVEIERDNGKHVEVHLPLGTLVQLGDRLDVRGRLDDNGNLNAEQVQVEPGEIEVEIELEPEAGDDHGGQAAGHDVGDDRGGHGADDLAGDDHGGQVESHDVGDDHGGHGSDDPAGDDRGGHGADDHSGDHHGGRH
jgi:hypothetical protein